MVYAPRTCIAAQTARVPRGLDSAAHQPFHDRAQHQLARRPELPGRAAERNVAGKLPGRVGAKVELQPATRRWSSRLPEHIEIPMPKLVPSMTQGRLVKWYAQPGDFLQAGDLLCEVEVTGLLDEAPGAATVLLIETHEVGHLAKTLVDSGATVQVDHPIGVMVEDARAVGAFASYAAAGGASKNSGADVPAG
eukprot:CAMPEP_0180299412 /NCGR_PEP_ID=MMETSP0988-20121125/22103_1 /TAXON_ID=697907 /ORGANISM="non described non described, Strain CCMP2293" /LENGTH=192 /DNA_ID=CAMNT_0022279225 /DNA_START=78 /DNA_END=652 /DNA_ORIENTATION=-